jgi:hypothetical protein
MRERQRILSNLEALYKEDFEDAQKRSDQQRMDRLNFDFQRDQLYLEVLLDVRELLIPPAPAEDSDGTVSGVTSLLDKAAKLRNLTRLR